MATLTILGTQASREFKGMMTGTPGHRSDVAGKTIEELSSAQTLGHRGHVTVRLKDKIGQTVYTLSCSPDEAFGMEIAAVIDAAAEGLAYEEATPYSGWKVSPDNFSTGTLELTIAGSLNTETVLNFNTRDDGGGIPFSDSAKGNGVATFILPFNVIA